MDYQNKPVEWINKEEVEKVAAKEESNNVRDGALAAGGLGAIGYGAKINTKQINKANVAKKVVGVGAGAALARLGTHHFVNNAAAAVSDLKNMRGSSKKGYQAVSAIAHAGGAVRGLQARAAGGALIGASLALPVRTQNKKLLASKLGLITGGTAALGAAAYNQLKEKNAADATKSEDDYREYVTRRQAGTRNAWKGVGGLLAGIGIGTALAAGGAPALGTLAAIGGYGYGLGKINEGSLQIGQATYLDPDRRNNMFYDFTVTPTESRYTRDVGILDRFTGAQVDLTKRASDDKPESGASRVAKALGGYAAAGATGAALVGNVAASNPFKRPAKIRKALPFIAAAGLAAHGNALYQAGKYVQEH